MERIKWSSFFGFFLFVGLFVGLAYMIRNMPTGHPSPPANYYLIVFGAFGLWLSIVSMVETCRQPFKRNIVLSGISQVCGMLGFFSGVFVGFAGTIGSNRSWAEVPMAYPFFGFYVFLVVIQLIIWFILAQRVVPPGMMIISENLVLRPGRKYKAWPFIRYERTIIKETINIVLSDFVFCCHDGKFITNCEASVLLGVGEMRPGKFFYQEDFGNIFDESLKKFMDGSIAQLTLGETLGQVIRQGEKGVAEPAPLGNLDVCGLKFPIYWDGKIKLSDIKTHE